MKEQRPSDYFRIRLFRVKMLQWFLPDSRRESSKKFWIDGWTNRRCT